MTRIGTFGQSQSLLNDLMLTQARLIESQRQVSSGQKTDRYSGMARDVAPLMSTKAVATRTEQHIRNNAELALRLNHYDSNLRGLADIADALRQQVLDSISANSATGMMDEINNLFDRAVSLLNSRLNGRYVFAGTRTNTPPVNVSTPAELLALSQTSDAFDNNSLKAQLKIDDVQTLQWGVLAQDVGQDLFEAFRRIMQFNAGTLPSGASAYSPAGTFTAPLGTNQRDFLINELSRLESVASGLNDAVAQNGINLRTLEEVQERLTSEKTFLAEFISDIENVDVAEAISRLNQDQVAVEASYRVIAQLNRTTLMDFL